ncbi:MAG: hypothetical protein ONB44_21430 [candidate division KSB1 bacterium]|nr:hypothetical protein [candidate division KSB1 bacterium]MDZ7304698.1 hypothetical protein [candidate division KSB1 bacterium]MDZ7311684.1 hypothetical protein [candidate division KSB1 bacterium]
MKYQSLSLVTVGLVVAYCLAATGFAQQLRNAKERQDDKKGIAAATAAVADDRRDLDRLSDLVMKWEVLRKGGDQVALNQVEQQIALELRKDIWEAKVQAQQAEKETKQSAAELRSSRREVRQERRDKDADKPALRDDRHDRRDDRRDLRDDVRDEQKIKEILDRKRAIAKELAALQRVIDTPGKAGDKTLQTKQHSLLEEYLALSQQEIQLGIREIKEDKKELREDRRERREDRKP